MARPLRNRIDGELPEFEEAEDQLIDPDAEAEEGDILDEAAGDLED